MKKTITAIIVGSIIALGSTGVWAKSYSCEVIQVEGDNVTLQCKKTDGLTEGMKVKVKTSKKKAIEGC